MAKAPPTVSHLDAPLKDSLLEVLHSGRLMAVSTQRQDGFPQTTHVNYVNEDLVLYFATDANAQKIGNISLNDKVSGAIAIEMQNYYRLKGLSFSGLASRVRDNKKASEIALALFKRTPQSRRFVPEDPSNLAIVRISPVAMCLIDYSKGFGTSVLVEFA